MTAPPILFHPGDGGVRVDLNQLVASRLLIQANSGGGKSRMLRYLLEQTHGRIQQIVLDPEGEFATLRERFGYLLAGRDGDVPAEPKTAKLLARRLLELSASAVIDLYDLPLDQRRRFVRLFLEELMHLPRSLWRPLLVVIDEAHVFIPERGSGEAESTEAAIALCTQGRKRGFAAVLATQRISKLHKDAAAEQLNKLIGRTGLDVDLKRAGDELGMDKEARLQLRDLEPGEFYAFGPAISRTVVKVRSGPIVTTHPQPGAIAPPAPPPPAAVQKVITQLHDLAKRAEEEAKTESELREQVGRMQRRIRELERPGAQVSNVVASRAIELAVADAKKQMRGDVEHARALVLEQAKREKQLRGQIGDLGKRLTKVGALLSQIVPLTQFELQDVAAAVPKATNGHATPTHTAPDTRSSHHRSSVPRGSRQSGSASGEPQSATGARAALGSTPRKMLDALGALHTLGVEEAERTTVAGWCDISASTGTFRNYLSDLRRAGLIEDRSGNRLALTDLGMLEAADIDVPDHDTLHAIWFNKLGGTQSNMLRVLIDAYPDPISREELGAAINISHTTGTFRNYLSDLRTPGLMRDVSKTHVAATDLLFPEGLD